MSAEIAVDFTSVRNHNERAVFDAVLAHAPSYPGVARRPDLLADVACVALNRLQPRYIRHEVDFSFYLTDKERREIESSIQDSVQFALEFVQARRAMRARA